MGGNELEAFRSEVTGCGGLKICCEVPVVGIAFKIHGKGIGDVVDNNSTDAFQTDECKGFAL